MIDREKLEAIRAEIERFRKTNKVSEDKEYAQYELDVKCGYDMALDDMLSYINSLSEETVRIKKGCKYRCLSDMQNTDTGAISFFKDKIYSAPEDNTLMSEENGWLCDTSENSSNFELVGEPVSDDLEQAAEEYEEKGRIDAVVSRKRDFINGAQWQKIQMMKDAIDGYVIEDIEEGNGDFLLSAEYISKSMGLKDRQRVKVIVIRED